MVAKIIAVILGLALTATSLLVVRQQRLQAVSDMTEAIGRAESLERRTWRLRAEIGTLTAPAELRAAIDPLGQFEPIGGPHEVLLLGDGQLLALHEWDAAADADPGAPPGMDAPSEAIVGGAR